MKSYANKHRGTTMKNLLLSTILLFQVGCNTPSIKNDKRVHTSQKYEHIIILGKKLQQEIMISDAQKRKLGNRHREAYIEVNSTIDTQTVFEYRFRWYDAEGYEVGLGMSIWKSHWIEGRSIDKISAIAPTSTAKTYKCYLKKP